MNEKVIWDFVYKKLQNPYGAAGLMGNLMAESSLNPIRANGVKKKYGITEEEYTKIANSGINNNFITDGVAYGLVQWCYHTRKQGLLEKAKTNKKSVGDIHIQLEYMWDELQKYKTVLNTIKTTTSLKDATNVVMLKYEKPANISEKAKEKRLSYAKKYYEMFAEEESKTTFNLKADKAKEIFKQLESKLK